MVVICCCVVCGGCSPCDVGLLCCGVEDCLVVRRGGEWCCVCGVVSGVIGMLNVYCGVSCIIIVMWSLVLMGTCERERERDTPE